MYKVFNELPIYIILFGVSFIYFILTLMSFKGEYIGKILNLQINSIPLFINLLIAVILKLGNSKSWVLKLAIFLIMPLSFHILISYGEKYPGTYYLLKKKKIKKISDKNQKKVKMIAIYGTLSAIIGIVLSLYIRIPKVYNTFKKLFTTATCFNIK